MQNLMIVQLILDIIQKISDLWGRLDKKVVAASLVSAMVASGVLVGGYFLIQKDASPQSVPKVLGGLDLGLYCDRAAASTPRPNPATE